MASLNIGHYVLGMEGLALLRMWLRGADASIDDRIREIARFVGRPDQGPLAIRVDVPEKTVREGYAAWSETYDALPNPLVMQEEPVVHALIDGATPGRAVDAACGTGRHAAYLVSRGHHVVGIDTSPEMLEKARARVPAVEFRAGELTELPVEAGSADLAVCSLALTHCADLGAPIRELARVVRGNGRVILSDQHPVMALIGGSAFFTAADGSFAHVTSYFHPHSAYIDAFNAAGLSIRQCAEPKWTEETVSVVLRYGGLGGLADDALRTALLGVPGALVWELTREP